MPQYQRELQVLGAYVHGVLSAFHALGVVYNYKRGNKFDALIHSLALVYDVNSTIKHYKAIKTLDEHFDGEMRY